MCLERHALGNLDRAEGLSPRLGEVVLTIRLSRVLHQRIGGERLGTARVLQPPRRRRTPPRRAARS